MNKWICIRVALVLMVSVASMVNPFATEDIASFDWLSLLVIFTVSPIALLLVIGIQAFNSQSQKVWLKPSWSLNPFNFGDPLQFFHLGGYIMLAQGLVTLLQGLVSSSQINPLVLAPAAMGLGTLIGVHLAVFVYRRKYNENT